MSNMNKSPTNSELSYSASDNDGEGKEEVKTFDLTKKQHKLSPAESRESPLPMVMAQKEKETLTTAESSSNEVVDLLKQLEIFDNMTEPKKSAIDLLSCVPTASELSVWPEFLAPSNMPQAPTIVDMANMMAQMRQLFDIYQPRFDSLNSAVQEFGYCLSDQMCMELAKFFEELQKRQAQLKVCHALLQQMASTDTSKSNHNQQIVNVLEGIKHFFEQLAHCELFASVQEKCQSAAWLRGVGVVFVGRATMDLATALSTWSQQKKSQYVFFHNADIPPSPDTNACLELFRELISKGERCIYVDTSLAELPPGIPTGDRIAKYFISKLVNTDFLMEAARKLNTCIVRMDGTTVSHAISITDGTAVDEQFELEIPCPKAERYGGPCSNDECRWECEDCGQLVVIHKPPDENTHVEHFHCACGQVPLTGAKFRCKDADLHGHDEFVVFPSAALADQLRYYGEKNLLILGETGVGKSTWINAFANFNTFGTLEEAIQSENPLCLIPTSFPCFDKDLVEKIITIGPQDNNESNETGQSQTKMPKAHVFELKTGRMREIDTPGMADTAGLKQDQQNFKYTLRYISTLKELNGIAILMDANRTRLTPAFKYCIGQLLTHLHKDAAKNIVFVFTKCGQRKNPGLALTSLRKYLEEVMRNNGVEVKTGPDQVYIMENDAFKFIHEVKQGVEYTEADYEHMEFSWSLSKSESTRLLQYILKLKPHKPMDTFSLNQARSYILALAQPLAKSSQAIQTDITVLTDKRDWLQTLDANELDLETAKNAMKIPKSYYEIEHLNYPRTVCASAQHIEIVLDGQGQQKILYKTICHEHCGLNDVPPEMSHCNQLINCTAMSGQPNCRQCGCHYTAHMHIRYLQHLRTKLVDDDQQIAGVMAQLEKTHDKKAAVEAMIILLEKRVDDQRAEQAIISKHSAKLSTFLKRHAIMAYNDAIEEYVLMSINDEKLIANVTGDNRKVEGLEDCLRAYREEKRIIDAAMDNNELAQDDEFDVQAIYGELINLQINGQNIKEMFDAEFDSSKKLYDFSERFYTRPNGRKASKNNRSRQFSSQRGFQQQQPLCRPMHGQLQYSRSMTSSLSGGYDYNSSRKELSWEPMSPPSLFSSTISIHHPQSNVHSYDQISSNWTYGNNYGTAYRPQQGHQQHQRSGNIGNAWGLASTSSATAPSMAQMSTQNMPSSPFSPRGLWSGFMSRFGNNGGN